MRGEDYIFFSQVTKMLDEKMAAARDISPLILERLEQARRALQCDIAVYLRRAGWTRLR